jgi:PAS domain S-box-containing protein
MSKSKIKILLVDDQPANLTVLASVLAELDETLIRAASGEAALRELLVHEVALVLMDVQMPTMSGFETARLIRSHPRSHDVPIIFLTAASDVNFPVEEAYALGAVDYLTKPFNPLVLRAKVAIFIDLHRKNAAIARHAQAAHMAALKTRDERIRLILDNTRDYAFIGTDPDGIVTEWEGGAESITGWWAAHACGQRADIIFTPEDRVAGRPEAEMRRARDSGRAEDKRWHVRKDGTRFFADGVMVPLMDDSQGLRGYAKIFRDATAERLAAEQLELSEVQLGESMARFSLLLESSGEGIYGMGIDNRCAFFNPAGAAMLGYQPHELEGRELHRMIHHHRPDGAPYPIEQCRILAAARAGRALRVDDEVFWRKDGTPVPVAYSVYPMVIGGQGGGAVVTFVDISGRKYAELERDRLHREVQAAGERLADIFQRAPAFMCVMRGPQHVFEMVNQRYLQLVGGRARAGLPIRSALPELEGQEFIEALDNVYRSGDAFEGSNVRLLVERHGALEERFVDFVYIALREPEGGISGVLVHGIDVTERTRAEDGLRRIAADLSEADRRKSEFLATLAHELRNPLAPIRTGLDLLRMPATDLAATARVHAMMDRQLGHLIHLVNDLLDIARITRGKIALARERTDLRTLVGMAVETSMALVSSAGHQLDVNLPQQPLMLEADSTRIVQVLSNLLNNAAKYTPGGGRITLSAWREGAEAVVAVADTGVGVPEEALGIVFEMFTQVGRSLERSQGGLGIGLSLVRRLAELHGGSVSAASPGRDQGSTFTVRLPLLGGDGAGLPAPEAALRGSAGSARRVLVVDDNVDAAESLAALLDMLGHTTRMAADGVQGYETALAFRPELIFLDIGLPGMDGHEVARALRQTAGMEDVMLVALTGWGGQDDVARSAQAGFDQHLTKPVDVSALESVLASMQTARAA